MPVIRYKRKRPLKTRERITNQIISHDFRGFTLINVDRVSYGQHLKMLKVIIIYLQGLILPGLSSTFELMTSPEVTWLSRSYVRRARDPWFEVIPEDGCVSGATFSRSWTLRGHHTRGRLYPASSTYNPGACFQPHESTYLRIQLSRSYLT